MEYLNKTSLFQTVDNVSEAILFNINIGNSEKIELVNFIVNQQGKPGTYADTFAPTEKDLKQDLILFTGEKIKTGAGKRHMIGEEASRILRKLRIENSTVITALQRADTGLLNRIRSVSEDPRYKHGTYCCKSCTCALWLNLASGGLNNDIDLLKAGLAYLKNQRNTKGKWHGFPYFYTLYVLNEVSRDLAIDELQYAAPSIEKRLIKKKSNVNKYELRRNTVDEQILKKVNTN